MVQPLGGYAAEWDREDAQPLAHRAGYAKPAVLLQACAGGGMLGDAEGGKHAPVALMGAGRRPGVPGPRPLMASLRASSFGLPLPATRQSPSPASLAPQMTQALRLEMPRAWTAPPCLWGFPGILAAFPALLPVRGKAVQLMGTSARTDIAVSYFRMRWGQRSVRTMGQQMQEPMLEKAGPRWRSRKQSAMRRSCRSLKHGIISCSADICRNSIP